MKSSPAVAISLRVNFSVGDCATHETKEREVRNVAPRRWRVPSEGDSGVGGDVVRVCHFPPSLRQLRIVMFGVSPAI